MPLRMQKKTRKEKQMPLQKGKCIVLKLPYNGQNTAFRQEFHVSSTNVHALYVLCIVYMVK